jgi:hypothetical protein
MVETLVGSVIAMGLWCATQLAKMIVMGIYFILDVINGGRRG